MFINPLKPYVNKYTGDERYGAVRAHCECRRCLTTARQSPHHGAAGRLLRLLRRQTVRGDRFPGAGPTRIRPVERAPILLSTYM